MSKLQWRGARFTASSALFTLTLLFLSAVFPAFPHDPITTKLTWTAEISRIVYKRCTECHGAAGPAFSLATYDDARPWAKAIRDEVIARRMPPWGAVKGIGDFKGDTSLSGPEIDMLVAWVEGGAPEGDPIYLPHRIPVPPASKIAEPAHAMSIPVMREETLKRPARVVALRPKNLGNGQSLEAWAVKPDGEVVRLIWLKDYLKNDPHEYVLREPLALPAVTRLRVSAPSGAALEFLFE